jgi:hypothetical protein
MKGVWVKGKDLPSQPSGINHPPKNVFAIVIYTVFKNYGTESYRKLSSGTKCSIYSPKHPKPCPKEDLQGHQPSAL